MNAGFLTVGKYKTAHASSITELDAEVNKLIEDGFQPFGSPYISDRQGAGRVDTYGFFQAMVRDKSYFVPA
jgi:hypothetical protein